MAEVITEFWNLHTEQERSCDLGWRNISSGHWGWTQCLTGPFQALFLKWAESELSGKLKLITTCELSKHYFINIFHSLFIFVSRIIMSMWVNILCAMNRTYLHNLRPGRLKAQQDTVLFNPNSSKFHVLFLTTSQ